jgi:FlaA1/EpsC-like NDP-sugar epimerase
MFMGTAYDLETLVTRGSEGPFSPLCGSNPLAGVLAGLRRRAVSWLARLEQGVLGARKPIIVATLIAAFAVIYPLVFLIRFDGVLPLDVLELALVTLPPVVGVKLLTFLAMGSHRGGWCYPTLPDMIRLAETATLASAAVVLVNCLTRERFPIPRSVIVMDWAGTILLLGGVRGSVRLFREHYYPMFASRRVRRVLVVDSSEAALALVRAIHGQPRLGMRVVGILDPDPGQRGRTRAGVKVMGSPDDVQQFVARLRVETVLIPTPTVPAHQIRAVVAACGAVGVKVQVVPGFDTLLSGDVVVQPRDVDIHDLLSREAVRLDGESVGQFLRRRVVLVTGAAGSIGSEVCRQALAFGPGVLILVDHSENGLFFVEREFRALARGTEVIPYVASITDARRLRAVLARHRPAVVFHAAAYKHVPMMEANPGEAVRNNVLGTRTLVDEAVRSGVEAFVMVSTDKAVNPTSVMGASKRLAEMYVQALSASVAGRLVTVRFGNVLGSNGSVVPIFKEQIRRGGPVTVTHPEMTRYFMTIPEATQLVLQAAALGRGGEIFVLDMGKPVKVVNLARDLIRLSGLTEGREIEIVFTGLRPGEKLYEELYDTGEQRLPTPHPKIFRAKHRPYPMARLQAQLDQLAGVVDGTAEEVIAGLKELVPEYRPGRPAAPGPGAGPPPGLAGAGRGAADRGA